MSLSIAPLLMHSAQVPATSRAWSVPSTTPMSVINPPSASWTLTVCPSVVASGMDATAELPAHAASA
jgi:hypothetical protein